QKYALQPKTSTAQTTRAARASLANPPHRKLMIGPTHDPLEREADRIAGQITLAPESGLPGVSPDNVTLRRRCACGGSSEGNDQCEECQKNRANRIQRAATQTGDSMVAPPSVEQILNSPGRPLEPTLRHTMERRFGHDFSRVHVHSGAVAAQSAREVKAHAYTVGQDIVFRSGQYAPETLSGRKLLAHELTHVVQQDGGLAAVNSPARLQRLSFSDVLEVGATVAVGPVAGQLIHNQKQFIDDLVASVKESPQHVGEFLKDEVWESIKDHWLQIIAVTTGLILAEMAVGALMAVPEPTLLTKVIAAILQIAIIAIIGYFAALH